MPLFIATVSALRSSAGQSMTSGTHLSSVGAHVSGTRADDVLPGIEGRPQAADAVRTASATTKRRAPLMSGYFFATRRCRRLPSTQDHSSS